MKSNILILLLILTTSFNCRTKRVSNFYIDSFAGKDLLGKEIEFRDLNFPRVAINVYSPTCIPCFKEIPTLNYLREEMLRSHLGEFFMVVDPYSIVEGSENKTFEEVYPLAVRLMQEEVSKRNITLPIIIMRPPFKVTPGAGLITGTPETLLLKTNPLILYYNFIGSISEKETIEAIQNDLKVKFFKRTVGGI
jgi:hypothetical protein